MGKIRILCLMGDIDRRIGRHIDRYEYINQTDEYESQTKDGSLQSEQTE